MCVVCLKRASNVLCVCYDGDEIQEVVCVTQKVAQGRVSESSHTQRLQRQDAELQVISTELTAARQQV
jgi:hypothetical protein